MENKEKITISSISTKTGKTAPIIGNSFNLFSSIIIISNQYPRAIRDFDIHLLILPKFLTPNLNFFFQQPF